MRKSTILRVLLALSAFASLVGVGGAADEDAAPVAIGPQAAAQMRAILAAKEARSPVERKMSFRILAAVQEQKGIPTPGLGKLRSAVKPDAEGYILVEVRGFVGQPLLKLIGSVKGVVRSVSKEQQVVLARLPLARVEAVAASWLVRSIRPAPLPMLQNPGPERSAPGREVSARPVAAPGRSREPLATLRPGFEKRASNVAAQLAAILSAGPGDTVSEGVAAHRADRARDVYGATGAGVKIGVLSDSVLHLADVQAAGELPAVNVLQDIDPLLNGSHGSGEGTAMLEIVHDMAPAAELFFASAFNGEQSFADNIRALRAAGCHIIVDDVFYFDESPFQDGPVAAAVNDVTNSGALYFSSAGNQGNVNDGTAGVWEGMFKKALVPLPTIDPFEFAGYQVHDFATDNISNRMGARGGPVFLFWNEPYGQAKADYDLFVLDRSLQTVVDGSADTQNGNDFPIEAVSPPLPGERLVIVKGKTAASKRLHLNTYGGRLAVATTGQTHGHSSAAAAYSVAAVNAAYANGGAFVGGQTNPVEVFSSDGYRQIYFNTLGKPAPALRSKPDIAAADGVATTTPGFAPFFGTSAAAPHAAGVAALLKSTLPALTPAQVRMLLTTTAHDIEARGQDRDSGFGIVDAFAALRKGGAKPVATLGLSSVTATTGGDGDDFIEPGENASLSVELANVGGADATAVSGTLTTATPNVTVIDSASNYPDLAPAHAATNAAPFTFSLAPAAECGLRVDFDLDLTFTGPPGSASPQSFPFSVLTGQPGPTPTTVSYAGPPAPIPDGDPSGVDATLTVPSLPRIANLTFSFDGTACTADPGSTSVGLDHTWVGDLVVTLTSPHGTTVTLISRAGGPGNDGNNFCGTVLDDSAADSIDTVLSATAPFTGTFRPHEPLSAFDGEDPTGVWTLNVRDLVFTDSGSVRAFSLGLTPFVCN